MSTQPCLSSDQDISFNTFNITPTSRKVQETFFGKIRAFSTITTYEWAYLGISILGLTAALGITIERLVNLATDAKDFTFALYFLLTIVFCFYYVIHAVLTERPDELSIYVICNIIALVYCIGNYIVGTRNALKLARLIVVCLMSTVLVPSGVYQTYKYVTSNYLIFQTVGGLEDLHKACRMYYFCSTLLKFDLQLQLTMLILVRGTAGRSINQTEELTLGVGMAITIVFFVLGFVGLCLENRTVMTIFFFLGLWEPGYVIYKFAYVYLNHLDATTYCSILVCGVIALIVWAVLMICTGYFTKNYFYKGLKEKMFGQEQTNNTQAPTSVPPTTGENARPSSMSREEPVPPRSILPCPHDPPQTHYQQVLQV